MAVDDFLKTYQESMLNRKPAQPLSASNIRLVNPEFGIQNPDRSIAPATSFGEQLPEWLQDRQSTAVENYLTSKGEITAALAEDYASKAAGQVPVDEYGIVQDKTSDFSEAFNKQLGTIGDIGKADLAAAEARAEYNRLQELSDLNAGYSVNWTPGASSDNPGAQAVAIAMEVANSSVPYVWGGNSLTSGVDCSGLVKEVYEQLGIDLPRTTYEQAKYGKTVGMDSLLPGDLIFYNTGSSDPNGIGTFSHVAIYIGNGQVIHAPRSGQDVQVASINSSGNPSRAVRPW